MVFLVFALVGSTNQKFKSKINLICYHLKCYHLSSSITLMCLSWIILNMLDMLHEKIGKIFTDNLELHYTERSMNW